MASEEQDECFDLPRTASFGLAYFLQ